MAGTRLPGASAAGSRSAIALIAALRHDVVFLGPTVSLYSHGSELYRSRSLFELSATLSFDRTSPAVCSGAV